MEMLFKFFRKLYIMVYQINVIGVKKQDITSSGEGLAKKSLQWQTMNRRNAFRGKKKIDLPDRIYDNPLQHFPLLNTVSQSVEVEHGPLPSLALNVVDFPQAITGWEVVVREDVVPLGKSKSAQQLVQKLKNH